MPSLTRKRLIIFTVLLFLASVTLSAWIMEIRRAGLQFHTRDYNYFIEQAARLADPGLRDQFALNVEGYNFIGLQGSEGATDIFQAIHTEYFRYSYTLLYAIFRRPQPLYVFFGILFFLPVLYAAALARAKHGSQILAGPSLAAAALFAVLWVLYPATFPSAAGDLRSRFLFPAAWALAALAVGYDRPFREKLPAFLFLLAIREEGILLGGLWVVMNFFRTRRADRARQTAILGGLVVLGAVIFVAWLRWNGYLNAPPEALPVPIPPEGVRFLFSKRGAAALVGLAALAAALVWAAYRRAPRVTAQTAIAAAYVVGVLLPATQTARETVKWFGLQGGVSVSSVLRVGEFLADPFSALPFYMLLLLLPLALDFARGSRRALGAGLALAALFLVLTLQTLPPLVSRYRAAVPPARLVWDAKAGLDPYTTGVLVDYRTLQGFYDFNEVIVYQRLPLWIAHPHERFYPENRALLAQIIREQLSVAVVGIESVDEVTDAAALAGVRVETVRSNDQYAVLRLIR